MSDRRKSFLGILLGPGLFWLVTFFIVPAILVVVYSFLTRRDGGGVLWQFSLDAWTKFFTTPPSDATTWLNDYVIIFVRSFRIAGVTTLLCLLFGYPLAFYIAQQPTSRRGTLLFMVMIPFWTNFLVRTYSWLFILNNNGLLNGLLEAIGLPTLSIIGTETAVQIGQVYGSLPFMILPLYASIEKLDFSLVEAAQDLGATYWNVFRRIILPLTLPGIAAGSVLVFIPAAGQYVVPTILGKGKVTMLGSILEQQYKSAANWPFGSVMGVVFMVLLMAAVVYYIRSEREEAA
jgi:spermidine/putrescine transport system permease protein